ncbi:hypothetical protein ASZ90_017288 [hydrocarbon metagenome]|uniref:Uncharacterized protein n=1 Tax=hydrocarbon metagenome TaxID=938273 RepID=A0A0W8E9J1_9ZZZZ
MRKALLYLIIFASLCAVSGYGIDYHVNNKLNHQSPYYLSFASIGAISLESRLDCWAKINQELSQDELETKFVKVLKDLGMARSIEKIIKTDKEYGHHISYTVQSKEITYVFSAETDSDKNETYFLLNVVSTDPGYELSGIEEKLSNGDLNWHYYYLYTGKLDHYVDQESRNQLIDVILQNVGAGSSEIYEDQYMTSITAYTPLFENSVTVQNKKYNIQVAAKSTPQQQGALIYIGQPLIIGDY